jgi:hypothetical protein
MQIRDRVLYHQIHPLKLITDVSTAIGAAALFWRHHLGAGLALGFLPSIVVSAGLIRWADLERYRSSAFGRYVAGFMTRGVELARLVGLLPLWIGAWRQSSVAVAAGVAWILGCWFWGALRPTFFGRDGQ